MNILLIVKNFDCGGAEAHVCDLANQLHRQGHTVYLISRPGRYENRINSEIKHLGLNINAMIIPSLIRALRLARAHSIDIIHGHQHAGILLGTLVAKLTGTPVVATVHGRTNRDIRSHLVRKWLDKVILISDSFMDRTQSLSFKNEKNKCHMIHNGVSTEGVEGCQDRQPLTLCYAARMDRSHHDVCMMLIEDVWPQLIMDYPEARLIIIGDGNESDVIGKRVREFNNVNDDKLIRFLGFQLNILPALAQCSLVMGVGRVAVEALSVKTPLLSMNAHHLGTLVTARNYRAMRYNNFVAVEAPPPDPGRVLARIKTFLSDQGRYASETARLHQQVRADFSIENTTAQTVGLYRDLVKTRQ